MYKKIVSFLLLLALAAGLTVCGGCSPIDKNYGVSSKPESSAAKAAELPTIKSDDTVMPLYFDISL